MKKTVKAWAGLDRKNILFVGCGDSVNHLEIFRTKHDAINGLHDPDSGLKVPIVPCTITYETP